MKNRAQTALEFLMTYGWALIIVLIFLVVAWQFGLFSPKNTEKGSAGFWGIVPTADDFRFKSDGTLTVSFQNQIGSAVNITRINATVGSRSSVTPATNIRLDPGENRNWDFTNLGSSPAGSRFEALVSVDYIDDRTGETYRSSGKIFGSVENS